MSAKDKYGKSHPNIREAEFANRCYEMMQWLTYECNLKEIDASIIVGALIDSKPEGTVARTKFSTFITLTQIHLRKPGEHNVI